MQYIEIVCKISNPIVGNEIMIAILGDMGCDSFVENSDGILAYIPKQNFEKEQLEEVLEYAQNFDFEVDISFNEVEEQDWNAKWESEYQPVLIDDRCYVRAPFHDKKDDVDYDILIEPKMSFGTAHHPTTSQIISYLLEEDCQGKTCLDMGTGTGVLAILAAKRGAKSILAIDNDEWAYRNCLENVEKNHLNNIINGVLGDANSIKRMEYDIVIANINRNILLRDMQYYVQYLKKDGILYLSGFYKEPDLQMLVAKAQQFNVFLDTYKEKDNWVAARLQKK